MICSRLQDICLISKNIIKLYTGDKKYKVLKFIDDKQVKFLYEHINEISSTNCFAKIFLFNTYNKFYTSEYLPIKITPFNYHIYKLNIFRILIDFIKFLHPKKIYFFNWKLNYFMSNNKKNVYLINMNLNGPINTFRSNWLKKFNTNSELDNFSIILFLIQFHINDFEQFDFDKKQIKKYLIKYNIKDFSDNSLIKHLIELHDFY